MTEEVKMEKFDTKMNYYKRILTSEVKHMREFSPLKSWPAVPHSRQNDLEAFKAIPSFTPSER